MPGTLQIIQTIFDQAWMLMSSIEVFDLGFSFAELFLGFAFGAFLIYILKLIIFGGNLALGSFASSYHSDILQEQKAQKKAESDMLDRMVKQDRYKAKREIANLRAAKRANPSSNKDLSSLGIKK